MSNKWTFDMTFMYACLSAFTNRTDEQIKEEIYSMKHIYESHKNCNDELAMYFMNMSSGLPENFFNGYIKAIDKYGLAEGNARIKERTIQIILKNKPELNRDELLEYVGRVDREERNHTIMDVMKAGIHLRKDENGNYTMEE